MCTFFSLQTAAQVIVHAKVIYSLHWEESQFIWHDVIYTVSWLM